MKLIDGRRAAKLLGVRPDSVRKLVQRDHLEIVTTTGQKNYFDQECVKNLAKQRKTAARRKKNKRLSRV